MRNEDVHKRFTQSEIRDFLAQELSEGRNKGGMVSIEYMEDQIKQMQTFLKYARKRESIIQLIEDKSWKEWDIDEDIPYDRENYFPFIGTKEEYNKLVETLKKEENTK